MSKQETHSLDQWVIEFQEAGQEWVRAKLKADQLDEGAKNYLASLMNDLEKTAQEKLSEAKLERWARGSNDYINYTTRMCQARADMLSKRVRYDALDKWFESKRSGLSFEKEVIKKGIFDRGGKSGNDEFDR